MQRGYYDRCCESANERATSVHERRNRRRVVDHAQHSYYHGLLPF